MTVFINFFILQCRSFFKHTAESLSELALQPAIQKTQKLSPQILPSCTVFSSSSSAALLWAHTFLINTKILLGSFLLRILVIDLTHFKLVQFRK